MGSEPYFPDAAANFGAALSGKYGSDPNFSWRPPILATSALREQGVVELRDAIDAHRAALERTGEIERRRASIAERRLLAAGEAILREQFARNRNGKIAGLLERLRARTLSPRAAARGLLRELRIGGDE